MARIVYGLATSHGPMLSIPSEYWSDRVSADRENPKHFYQGNTYTFDQMVDTLINDVKSLGYDVTLSDQARATLRGLCLADLSNGGRGIRNQVEAHLINPLSRGLFDSGSEAGGRFRIQEVQTGTSSTLRLESEPKG